MQTYKYTIRLTSDAEPGTGLGGESYNELIPRNHEGRPVIRASHVKGLMREAYVGMARQFGWDEELEGRVFGFGHRATADDATIRLLDAVATSDGDRQFVTRTAVGDDGVVVDKSLRTTESVPIGTEFEGQVLSTARVGSAENLAWRLALRSIPAIGGSRNRGCGQCVFDVIGSDDKRENGSNMPGQLLVELNEVLKRDDWKQQPSQERNQSSELAPATVVLRLTFEAETPICCPEITDKTNVISSGFSIPASAVQGVILHRINELNSSLASRLFECPDFRAWPLHPTGYLDGHDDVLAAIRVSLTHRVKKFTVGDQFNENDFQDEAIAPIDWTKASRGAPLKASDGVLLYRSPTDIKLWPARSMPHVISSHGVHNDRNTPDGRNLFTVDAMAPLRWQGIVVLPENVAKDLQKSLESNPMVAVGKSRTVRGLGRLSVSRVENDAPVEWQHPSKLEHTVLVAQSPLLIESEDKEASAEELLPQLIESWRKANNLSLPPLKDQWANAGVRFGWNRTKQKDRLDACKVFLPGTVIAFESPLDDTALAALRHGIGGGRDRGYGAVSVHPGPAIGMFKRTPQFPTLLAPKQSQNQKGAIEKVLAMARETKRLPSPAQIRALQQRVQKNKDGQAEARRYLERQINERPSRIWHSWEPIVGDVLELLDASKFNQSDASRALVLLADLAAE
ncbi:MAG: RAMP superfamily CRISPR-associated protein [Planctomycetota bacterium]